jgi:hypothetical protein
MLLEGRQKWKIVRQRIWLKDKICILFYQTWC